MTTITPEDPLTTEPEYTWSLSDYFHLFLTWIITLDGDDSELRKNKINTQINRNYVLLTQVTNYVFLLGGRFRTVKRTRQFSLIVLAALIIPAVLYAATLAGSSSSSKTLTVLFFYFWANSLANFILCATTDPGCLPRNIHLTDTNNLLSIPQEYNQIITLPATNNANSIQLKYCRTCRIWRPPRSFHCSQCGSCISTQDHHCIWMNNCIGRRNYRFFLLFLTSTIIASFLLIASCATALHRRRHHTTTFPVAVLLICYAALGAIYPVILLSYHVALTATQQTTREYLRRIGYRNPVMHGAAIRREEGGVWDTGSLAGNVRGLMCEVRGCCFVGARERGGSGDSGGGDWRFVDCDKQQQVGTP